MKESPTLSTSARQYFGSVIAAGSAVAVLSAVDLYFSPVPSEWLFLAALTTLTGSFTVRIPTVAARISVSDAFVFASVLLFGPSTATVIVALDCLVMMYRHGFLGQPGECIHAAVVSANARRTTAGARKPSRSINHCWL